MPAPGCQLCQILSLLGKPEDASRSVVGDIRVECSLCGSAGISDEALDGMIERQIRPEFIRGYIREGNAQGQRTVKILAETLDEIESRGHAMQGVPDKLDRVLLSVADRTPHVGSQAEFNLEDDCAAFYAHDATELDYLFKELAEQKFVAYSGATTGPHARAKMLAAGWKAVEMLKQSGPWSRQCFVAMSFDEEHRSTWEAIARAVTEAGYVPYRIDEAHHADLIPWRILSDIRASRFVVADLTAHKHGVYFEAGFGLGLGRTVIWVCHQDDRDKTHFDVKQYNTLFYPDFDVLERQLRERIRAMIG